MENRFLLCRRYLASISGQIPSPPPLNPGPQARAQAGRGSTYKLALAASRKPQEHLRCGEWSPRVWTDQQPFTTTRPPPAGLAPDAFSTQGTHQQPHLLLALLFRLPIRAKDTSYPSLLVTSRSHSNSLRGGNCSRHPFSYWSEEMSISNALAYLTPLEA